MDLKKLVFFTILILGNALLESCCNDPDECFRLTISEFSLFSLNQNQSVLSSDTVRAADFALAIQGNTERRGEACAFFHSFGGGLYAINCDEPLFFIDDPVSNISIRSSADLSVEFHAGSELRALFFPLELNRTCLEENNSSPDCVRDLSIFEGITSLEDAYNDIIAPTIFYQTQDLASVELISLFRLRPSGTVLPNSHRFTIQMTFESGAVQSLETEELFLN